MQKRHLLQIAVLFFSVILMGFSVWAVPGTINYQGRLTDPNGAAMEGDYEMGFSLYNTKTGGSDIWSETQTVRITNGIYNVQLGALNPLSMDLFNDDTLYLEVRIEDEVLYPRERLTSAAFAMRAGVADVAIDAQTVSGIQPGNLLDTSSSTQTKAGGLNIGGKLGIGTDTPSGALHVNGTSILEGTLNIDTMQAGTTSLDQSQTSKQLTSFLNADWQSFTAGTKGILTRIEVLSVEALSWGSTTLRIYEGEGTSGASLYEGQYDIGITAPNGLVAFDIPVESGPMLSSGSQYTFQIESIDGFVWLEFNNPYTGGRSSFGPERDFWFKTYMRIGYNPGGVVAVTPDGKVGIGTTSPVTRLEVAEGNIRLGNNSALQWWNDVENDRGAEIFLDILNNLVLGSQDDTSWPRGIIFETGVYPNVATEKMRIDGNGNVGIGTKEPETKLHVNGPIKAGIHGGSHPSNNTILYNTVNESGIPEGDGFRIRFANPFFDSGTSDALVFEKADGNHNDPDGGIAFVNTGSDGIEDTSMVIRGNGNVGIGTLSPRAKLDVVGNAAISGNLGIGTTSPGAKLDVNGDIRVNGKYAVVSQTNNIIQSGKEQKLPVCITINFPQAFSAVPNVVITPQYHGTQVDVTHVDMIYEITETYFTVCSANTSSAYYIQWIAVGPK